MVYSVKNNRWLIVLVLALLVSCVPIANTPHMMSVQVPTVAPTQQIEYVSGSWHVRKEPTVSGEHVCFVEDQAVIVLAERNGWLQITACGGGWISGKSIE